MGIIRKIGYATFQTADLSRLSEYYQQLLGLTVQAQTESTIYLACPLDRHSVVLEKGSLPHCSAIGLEVASDEDLSILVRHLKTAGVAVAEISDPAPGVKRRISFVGPDAFGIEVQVENPSTGNVEDRKAIDARRLGHVAFKVRKVQASARFFCDVLGFRVSDWIGDYFTFLRCGTDHHTVNFVQHDKPELHHIAFELDNFDHIKTACDFLGRHRIALMSGPGRHGPGHNIFTYHKNPDSQTVELYAELDQMLDEEMGCFDSRPWHEDSPQRPKVWEPGLFTTNSWGVPRTYSVRD